MAHFWYICKETFIFVFFWVRTTLVQVQVCGSLLFMLSDASDWICSPKCKACTSAWWTLISANPKFRFLIKVSAFLTFRKRFEDILSIFHCPQFIVCWLLILNSTINFFGPAKMLFAWYNKLDLKKLKLEQYLGNLKLNIKSIISP